MSETRATIHLNVLSALDREPVFASPPASKQTTTISFYKSSREELSLSVKQAIFALRQTSSLAQRPCDGQMNPLESCATLNDVSFILEDPKDGSFVTLNASIPSNTTLNCLLLPPAQTSMSPPPMSFSSPSSRNTALANISSSTGNTNSIRAAVVKFERINAHLANERTWLAWIRTSVSILGCAFSFLSLADKAEQTVDWMCIALGCGFVTLTLVTFATGWERYKKVKALLSLSMDDINENFERLGVGHQCRFLGLLIFLTAILYYVGGPTEMLWGL
ncbi:hypothetical protein TrRE_jg9116 [Triparma retinervis]|uniref:DUF202 domain-containing protein n=1 Tax=Triparma retinervis TaxID=2557542 RepID=A0A9W7A4L5_9STRA|nr:hypothetical protein TrRE_jg9116 [Triparma retinervis]